MGQNWVRALKIDASYFHTKNRQVNLWSPRVWKKMTYPICLFGFCLIWKFPKIWGTPKTMGFSYWLQLLFGCPWKFITLESHEIPLNHYELPVKSLLIPMTHMTCETSTSSRWQRLLQKRADLQRAARTGLRGRWTATDVACLGCWSVVFPMDPAVPSERKGMFGDVWGIIYYNLEAFLYLLRQCLDPLFDC